MARTTKREQALVHGKNLGHVTTCTSKNGGTAVVKCRCGWSVRDKDLLVATLSGEQHVADAVTEVVPPRFGFGHKSPARPVKAEKPVWEPHRRTRSSCTVDVDYGDLGYGEEMLFPTRKALVEHLREFLPRTSFVRGEAVAFGVDHGGEFTCVVDFGKKGGLQILVQPVESTEAA
jgi:hypothetical protein